MSEQDGWFLAGDKLPVKSPGLPSEEVWVRVQEFGQKPAYAVATCWVSDRTPLFPQWYLSGGFYHIDGLVKIAETVTHWRYLPEPPQEKP